MFPCADMLMPVELRSARRLGIVAVPHAHGITPNVIAGLVHGLRIALARDQCRSPDTCVWQVSRQTPTGAAPSAAPPVRPPAQSCPPSEHSAPAVFSIRMLKPVPCHGNPSMALAQWIPPPASALRCASDPSTSQDAAPDIPRPASAPARSRRRNAAHALLPDILRLAADIDQVAGVDHQRAHIAISRAAHASARPASGSILAARHIRGLDEKI